MRRLALGAEFQEMVQAERARQEAKWGSSHDHLPVERYLVALGEEYGEACRAFNDGDVPAMMAELVQVAAVCQRIFETFPAETVRMRRRTVRYVPSGRMSVSPPVERPTPGASQRKEETSDRV